MSNFSSYLKCNLLGFYFYVLEQEWCWTYLYIIIDYKCYILCEILVHVSCPLFYFIIFYLFVWILYTFCKLVICQLCELQISPSLQPVFSLSGVFLNVCAKLLQSYPTLCNPMDGSLPGFSVHGILQARTLEWVAMPSSGGSSQPRQWILM